MDSSKPSGIELNALAAERREVARHVLEDYLGVQAKSQLWIFTDPGRRWFADEMADKALELGLRPSVACLSGSGYSPQELAPLKRLVESLGRDDVVISAFSDYSIHRIPYFKVFPNLRPPEGYSGISAVIRAHYPDDALILHLKTPVSAADEAAARYLALNEAGRVHVTSDGGTDLECEIGRAILLPYKIGGGSRHAYLPPAEVAFGIASGSAEGRLVVDITAGDVVVGGKVVTPLGLVDEPVVLEISRGRICSISGGDIAKRLRDSLDRLGPENRLAVELGFGLSCGIPTGSGSADECLQGTFHLGFGDDSFFNKVNPAPVHLDLICRAPDVRSL